MVTQWVLQPHRVVDEIGQGDDGPKITVDEFVFLVPEKIAGKDDVEISEGFDGVIFENEIKVVPHKFKK